MIVSTTTVDSGFFIAKRKNKMSNVTEKTTIVDGVEIDADGVIVRDDKQLITGKVGDFFAENESDILSQGIIEIRTDCKESKFKIADNLI